MFAQTVAANGYALFNDNLRLAETQRVAFDGIAVIRQTDTQILMQALRNDRCKRPLEIQTGFFLFQASLEPRIKSDLVVLTSLRMSRHDIPLSNHDRNIIY